MLRYYYCYLSLVCTCFSLGAFFMFLCQGLLWGFGLVPCVITTSMFSLHAFLCLCQGTPTTMFSLGAFYIFLC